MLSPHAAGLSVWLGHGTLDRTVPIEIGSTKVVEFLKEVVGMKEAEEVGGPGYKFNIYPGLIHWIGDEQWEDVGKWLSERLPPVAS
jgi:lysophospholipase II